MACGGAPAASPSWARPRPVPVHGRFRVGSITKTFVATVVLQLVGEGRLRLDDPVERWLPGVVPDGHRITVRQLLNHTSGFYDYLHTLPMPPAQEFLDNRWRTWTAAELVQRAVAHPPTFEPPGSAYAYSNTNYLLLGQIVEKVTGRSYGKEIERRIIRPLRLPGTSMPGTSPWIRGPHPHGYVPTQRRRAPGRLHGDEPVGVRRRWRDDLHDGGSQPLLRRTARWPAAAGSPARRDEDAGIEGGRYGLGLAWRDTSCGIRVYGNDGDALAYQAWSFSTEDLRRQVTLALTPDFTGDPDDAVDAFLDEALCKS